VGGCAVPEEALRDGLDSIGRYVVLRNHDVFRHLRSGGDVDVLVEDVTVAEDGLAAALGPPRFVSRRSYVTSLFYDWGHVDLVSSLEWKGARYLDESAVFAASRKSALGLPRPRLAHEAVVSWFSSLLWGGFFKERYRDVILSAASEDGQEFARVLTVALGRRWGDRMWTWARQGCPETSELFIRQLRREVRMRALSRGPWQITRRLVDFYAAEVRLHLHPPLPWLAFLGPDGSGKSTAMEALVSTWPAALGEVHTYHLRPRRLPARSESTGLPVVDPHGQPARGPLSSVAMLAYWIVDWWVGYWGHIVRQRAKHGLVIFDRHFLDIPIDPRRYRYGGPGWVPRAASRLVPSPDMVIVLDAPPRVVRKRKQEVHEAESQRQHQAYRALAATLPEARLVDATAPPSEIGGSLLNLLREHLSARRGTEVTGGSSRDGG
jgi:thymidylate kinase